MISFMHQIGRRSTWTLGVFCILAVAVIWTFGSVLKQYLTRGHSNSYVITCVLNSVYTVQFATFGASVARHAEDTDSEAKRDVIVRTLKIALLIFPIWITSQFSYNAGLARTSITASTVASSTSIVWTYAASILFLREVGTERQVVGVALCVLGNVLLVVPTLFTENTTHHSAQNSRTTLGGTLLCLVSAMGYAAYTTLIKKWITEDASVVLFFAFIGLYSFLVALPVASIIEPGALTALSSTELCVAIGVGLVDNVLGQYLWAKGVLWTSSTVATVGMSLTIPLAIVADLCEHTDLSVFQCLASAAVVTGFVVIYRPPPRSAEEEPLNEIDQ